MEKLHILGSCSGTEPYPNCHQTSLVLEYGGYLYWFDAGECCAHTAYTGGLDLLKTRAIFISHEHIDHTGGLAHLLWCMRKLTFVRNQHTPFDVQLFMPNHTIFTSLMEYLAAAEDGFSHCFNIQEHPVNADILLETAGLKVEARGSHHLPFDEKGHPRAWSYRITIDGRKTIFSGDVNDLSDLGEWLEDCQLLLMETGHHHASQVCERLRKDYPGVHDVLFLHHGREILNDRQNAEQRATTAWGTLPRIAYDGMAIEI